MDENTDSNYVRDSTVIDDTIYGLINEAFEMERKTNNPEYRNSIFKENREYFVKTDDGSYSIKSREINHKVETLHTSTGAISESFEKFIKPLKLDYGDDIAILDICASLGYFQMQMNVVDSKTLIEAKKNPELHPNLIVRVWGFSAYFNDLPLEYKDVLIDRALRNEGKLAI